MDISTNLQFLCKYFLGVRPRSNAGNIWFQVKLGFDEQPEEVPKGITKSGAKENAEELISKLQATIETISHRNTLLEEKMSSMEENVKVLTNDEKKMNDRHTRLEEMMTNELTTAASNNSNVTDKGTKVLQEGDIITRKSELLDELVCKLQATVETTSSNRNACLENICVSKSILK